MRFTGSRWGAIHAVVVPTVCLRLALADMLPTKNGLRFEETATQQSDNHVLKAFVQMENHHGVQ